jgi:hypothetical protein
MVLEGLSKGASLYHITYTIHVAKRRAVALEGSITVGIELLEVKA